MISRRNIRVKAMQALYASRPQESTDRFSAEEAMRQYRLLIDNFVDTVGYCVVFWGDFFSFLHRNAAKYAGDIPASDYDRMYASPFFPEMLKSDFFRRFKKVTLKSVDPEWMNILYARMAPSIMENKEYILYMKGEYAGRDADIIQTLWTEEVEDSSFWREIVEEYIPAADCDDSILRSIMGDIFSRIKELSPELIAPEDKMKFGERLISAYIEKEAVISEILSEKTQNWDQNRLLKIDAILLRLGLLELLFFDDIPPKVTINEYVDIARMYSNQNSGLFINGILDAIAKDRLAM